ncbi:uncharacterized protein ELE39_002644 [Cryptosporidium sp. chipmunk genotype I]|uniref:uncharacterized protein n=1 Tax=Cryptosporidium sp. chipmunk genotype I TaxID=1280935 RepID=UPI00351A4165|nr:hypothetical protein ELE39_002644 [Cryptosporidium sp. chipmunk genotype I]
MTVLFLSSFSSFTISEINHKKGQISYLIFPFLKVYKKSFLHIANTNDLKNTKPVLNVYSEKKNNDKHFIIKLLKYVYIKEKNINKKKWITNQLKKITCFNEYKNESNFSLKTSIFTERNGISENNLLELRANIIPMQRIIIPNRNSTFPNYLTIKSAQKNGFSSFDWRLGANKLCFPKLDKKMLLNSTISDGTNDYLNNYFGRNHKKLLLSSNSNVLGRSFRKNNLIFKRPTIEGIKRDFMENNKAFLINLTNSRFSIIPTVTDINPIYYKVTTPFSLQKKPRSTPFHTKGKTTNEFGDNSRESTEQNRCSEGRVCIRNENGRAKYPFYNITSQHEKIFRKQVLQKVRLRGPFGYRE